MSYLTDKLTVTIAGLRGPGLSTGDMATLDEKVAAAELAEEGSEAAAALAGEQVALATAQADRAASEASAAAVSTTNRTDGKGAATGTAITNTTTYVMPAFDKDGLLDSVDVFATATGAGNLQWQLVTPNTDGTVNYTELSPSVLSVAGVNTANFGGLAVKKGQRLALRRSGATTGQFAVFNATGAINGIVDTYPGQLVNGATLTKTNIFIPNVVINWRETIKPADNKARVEQAQSVLGAAGIQATASRAWGNRYSALTAAKSSYVAGAAMIGPADTFDRSGAVDKIRIPVTVAGTILIALFAPANADGSQQTLERLFFYTAATTGTATLVAGTDFQPYFAKQGGSIAVQVLGGAGVGTISNANLAYRSIARPVQPGDTTTPSIITGLVCPIEVDISSAGVTYVERLAQDGDRLRGSTPLMFQTFPGTATPANWTLNGWTVNNGLVSPAAGAWTAMAKRANLPYNATRWRMGKTFTVNVASTALKFGLGGDNSLSGALLVNLAANALDLYDWAGTATAGTLRASVPITFATAMGSTTGRKYRLDLRRKRSRMVATLTDLATMEKVTLDINTSAYTGTRWKGNFGPIFVAGSGAAGDVTVNQFDMSLGCSATPKVAMLTDSIGEGSVQSDNDNRSFAERFDDARNKGDVAVFAHHGATSGTILTYIAQNLGPITPENIIIECVNDNGAGAVGSAGSWADNMFGASGILAWIAANKPNARVFLCTPTPFGTDDTKGTSAKAAMIRAGVYGSYTWGVIDMLAAVSDDGVTWRSGAGFQLSDNVHVTSAGAAQMERKIEIDQPGLLDGCFAGAPQ